MKHNYVSVGKILSFHGIKGDAKVGFSKNQQDFLASLDYVLIKKDNEYTRLNIENIRFHKNFAIIKFESINSIDELLEYKGAFLYVEENTIREALEEDEFLIDELVSMEVYDADGKKQGFVVGVSNNGANDLLSVKTNSKKIVLIPFVKAIVTDVSIKDRKIIINNIEGLLE